MSSMKWVLKARKTRAAQVKVSDGRHTQWPRIREGMECVGPAGRNADTKVDSSSGGWKTTGTGVTWRGRKGMPQSTGLDARLWIQAPAKSLPGFLKARRKRVRRVWQKMLPSTVSLWRHALSSWKEGGVEGNCGACLPLVPSPSHLPPPAPWGPSHRHREGQLRSLCWPFPCLWMRESSPSTSWHLWTWRF